MATNFDLRDIDFENIGAWPKPVKVTAILFACAVVIFLGYWFDTRSQLHQLSVAERREHELKIQYEAKQHLANNLPVYEEQMKELKKRFQKLVQILPEKTEVAGLLEEISKIAVGNGLDFQIVKPLPIENHEFYAELPIRIGVVGTYHQFAEFISDVAALHRIVTLDDFVIRRDQPPAAGSRGQQQVDPAKTKLEMTITAKTYWYTGDTGGRK